MYMITINVTGDKDSLVISGSVNGKAFGVSYDEQKYQEMLALQEKASKVSTMAELQTIVEQFLPLTKESYKEVVETACPYIFVNKHNNKYYLKYKNVMSKEELPQAFVDKILLCVEKHLPIEPLIKCWVRFLRNPNYTADKARRFADYITAPYVNQSVYEELTKEGLSHEIATQRATTTQVAITMEGLICGYKVSKEVLHRYELNENEEVVTKSRYKKFVDPDTGIVTYNDPEFAEDRLFEPAIMGKNGDEFYCDDKKGHHIRVGQVHRLESWDQVNCNDNVAGRPGLHVGGLHYIHGYQTEGTVTHNVLIDPMDIGAIVGVENGGDGAMRCKRYYVLSTFNSVNRTVYHSSTYAAMNDAEYAAAVQEAVEKTKAAHDEIDAEAQRRISLL